MGIRYDLVAIMLVLFGAGMMVGPRFPKEMAYVIFGIGLLLAAFTVIETEDWFLRLLFIAAGAVLVAYGAYKWINSIIKEEETNDKNKK
ncbi:hypothetical protein HYV22_00070 [Candidatus Gottesmanbacteria bacterium]|nr:hypothetical protein [Candidatus Gottesmanbacteria bacterium]